MARTAARLESQRALSIVAAVALVFFVAFALYWAQAILVPLALAVFFSFILTPLVIWLQRRGLGRVPSVLLVVFTTVLVCVAVGLLVGRQMFQLTNTLPNHEVRIKEKLTAVKEWVSPDEGSRLTEFFKAVSDIFSPPAPAATT